MTAALTGFLKIFYKEVYIASKTLLCIKIQIPKGIYIFTYH